MFLRNLEFRGPGGRAALLGLDDQAPRGIHAGHPDDLRGRPRRGPRVAGAGWVSRSARSSRRHAVADPWPVSSGPRAGARPGRSSRGSADRATHRGGSLFIEPDERFSRIGDAHPRLGVVLFALGETASAEREYEAAPRLDPRSAVAHYDMCLLRENQRCGDTAVIHYRRALEADPQLFEAPARLSRLLTVAPSALGGDREGASGRLP